MPRLHLILVPGFLGFQRLYNIPYFAEVEALLDRSFVAMGREVSVKAIRTLPTSSLGARAARLAEVIHELPADAEVHLVGHSTGGLDCRLLLSPGASLPTEVDVAAAAARVRSVVSVATPHHGAPLASVFTGVHGHRLMSLISLVITRMLHNGRRSVSSLVEVGKVVLLLDRIAGLEEGVRVPLRNELQAKHAGRDDDDPSFERLLDEIGGDSSLLEHLTPSSLALLNTTLQDRPGVRYGSVVAMAPRPRLRRLAGLRLDPLARLTYGLYMASHRLAGLSASHRLPPLRPEDELVLRRGLGVLPDLRDSDGIVPTRSQVWGTVIDAVSADHFDLMGYYGGRTERPYMDMLASGANFGPRNFEAMWAKVSRFVHETATVE